ncbi:MAG: hypothetical protein ABIF77_21920 [bacterium]
MSARKHSGRKQDEGENKPSSKRTKNFTPSRRKGQDRRSSHNPFRDTRRGDHHATDPEDKWLDEEPLDDETDEFGDLDLDLDDPDGEQDDLDDDSDDIVDDDINSWLGHGRGRHAGTDDDDY